MSRDSYIIERMHNFTTMKKLSETLTELGIAFSFPIRIKDSEGNETYFENIGGLWEKWEYGANGNPTYYERSCGYWSKREYDAEGNETYFEDSDGDWYGTPPSQSCDGKVIEIDGKKYKLTEL